MVRQKPSGNADAAGVRDVVFTAYIAVLLLAVIPPVWAALLMLPRGGGSSRLLRRGVRFVIRASGCSLRVRGMNRLEGRGPLVVVANHGSYLDSIMLMAVLAPGYLFVVNHQFASIPFFGLAVRKAGYLIVDRTRAAARRECVLAMIDTLRRGSSLVVFPEGTRHRGADLLPFRRGAFRAAVEAGRPIVPITLAGTANIWRPGTWLLHRDAVEIIVHQPIEPVDQGRTEITRLRDAARVAIAETPDESGDWMIW